MDEDERGMAFTTETDYEDGEWVAGEFYAKQRGRRRQMTKEDHLYGIFNNEALKPEPGSREKLGKSVGFVKASSDSYAEEREREENATGQRRGIGSTERSRGGIGGSQSKRGIGNDVSWQSGGGREEGMRGGGGLGYIGKGESPSYGGVREEGDGDETQRWSSTTSAEKRRKTAKKKKKSLWATSESVRDSMEDSSAWRDAKPAASWEKFTKGIGSKLMMRQGWKPGTGLGKEGRGVNRPIEVKQRPIGMGMGYNNFKEQSAATRIVLDPKLEEEMKEMNDEEEVMNAWKRKPSGSGRPGRQREKTQYKTVEEVLEKADKKQVIVDMRSGEEQVLSSAAEVAAASAALKSEQRCAELQFNTRMLADMAEMEIQRLGKSKAHKETVLRSLEMEMKKLEAVEKKRRENFEHLKAVQSIVAATSEKVSAGEIGLASLSTMFELLRSRFLVEYQQLRLGELAVPLVLPLLKKELATWMPLVEPTKHRELVSQFASTFKDARSDQLPRRVGRGLSAEEKSQSNDEAVFEFLMEEAVIPRLRTALQNNWNAKEHESALVLLEGWKVYLPEHAFDALLLRVILPKLQKAVEQWEPQSDTVPIHRWLHPWLPWLHQHLELLYGGIRRKMQKALVHWDAADRSALMVLEPWSEVFPKDQMESLLKKSIYPKLQQALDELIINPLDQELVVIQSILLWHTVIPLKPLARMLETSFFPKFLSVLQAWLNASPDYEELRRWYMGWKELFPPPLIARPRVRGGFHQALRLIDASLPSDV